MQKRNKLLIFGSCVIWIAGGNFNLSFAQEQGAIISEKLHNVEKAIEDGNKLSSKLNRTAENLRVELLKLRRKKVQTGAKIRMAELTIFELEKEIQDLKKNEQYYLSLLNNSKEQIIQVIFALRQLSRLPPTSLIGYPTSTSDLIRTSILLKGTVPQIKKQAEKLQNDLKSLNSTRKQITQRRGALAKANDKLKERRTEMNSVMKTKIRKRRQTLAARQVESTRIQRLTREAKTLHDLFKRLKTSSRSNSQVALNSENLMNNKRKNKIKPRRLDPQNARVGAASNIERPISLAKGKLAIPVVGRIINRYGKQIERGAANKGIQVLSNRGAQVVSPYDGKIVFAGYFRGYGQLLIIDHGEGYHSLLSGMTKIQGSVGQWLLLGEPIAIMGSSDQTKPKLYMELRKNGRPINPNPWLSEVNVRRIG